MEAGKGGLGEWDGVGRAGKGEAAFCEGFFWRRVSWVGLVVLY